MPLTEITESGKDAGLEEEEGEFLLKYCVGVVHWVSSKRVQK